MAGTLLDLAKRLEGKKKELDTAASEAAVFMAEVLIDYLAYATPVDTSKALSSWIVSLDSPSTVVGEAHYPGSMASSQKASAEETIRAAKEILKNKGPGQDIYATNNQPYITRLNDGYSDQAPAGYVEMGILIAQRALQNRKNIK